MSKRAIGTVLLVWLLWATDNKGKWTPFRTYDSLEAREAADQEFRRFDPKQQYPEVPPVPPTEKKREDERSQDDLL